MLSIPTPSWDLITGTLLQSEPHYVSSVLPTLGALTLNCQNAVHHQDTILNLSPFPSGVTGDVGDVQAEASSFLPASFPLLLPPLPFLLPPSPARGSRRGFPRRLPVLWRRRHEPVTVRALLLGRI